LNVPAIRLASTGSKLTLDNVMFDLGADFQFKQGQIFIHDEVAVTGTSAFIYQSPAPSYITSGATWSFEYGTTFSVAPSTASDTFYNGAAPYVTNNFIVLADSSSALYLNSCSFKTTFTGLRLAKGMVLFDNRVAVDTMAGVELDATTPATYLFSVTLPGTTPNPYTVRWSSDRKYLVVSASGAVAPCIYQFDGQNTPTLVRSSLLDGYSRVTSWSSDRRYLLRQYNGAIDAFQILRFTGNSLLTLVAETPDFLANTLSDAEWSPDGKFIATIHSVASAPSVVRVYRFYGIGRPLLVGSVSIPETMITSGDFARSILSWSPDGRFIAAANFATTGKVYVYRFRGVGNPILACSAVTSPANTSSAVWSPDGNYLAVTTKTGTNDTLSVYRFNGNNALTPVGSSFTVGGSLLIASWSPDGRYLALVPELSAELRIYRFDPSSGLAFIASLPISGAQTTVDWSPDGRFIASASWGANNMSIYRCNFVSTPVAQQGFTNGLVFGQSAKGSSYNANVKVLAGAGVALQGKVTDDSA
jgi:WD40 repeat protein